MLSPSEIHSLFHGLDLSRSANGLDGPAGSSLESSAESDQFTLPLALAPAERSALLSWQAAFGERWRQSWPERLRSQFALVNAAVNATRLRDFVSTLTDGHGFQAQSSHPQRVLWMVIDEGFVAIHLSCLLGAGESQVTPTVPLTWGSVEQQLTSRLVQGACEILFPETTGQDQSEWRFESVNSPADWIASAPVFLSCELVHFDFEIKGPASSGRLNIAIPRSLAVDFPGIQLSPAASTGEVNMDLRPTETVDLRAILVPLELSQDEFSQLQVGDVLLTAQANQSPCLVVVNGQPRYQATIGSHQGHKAVRLTAEM